MADCTPAIYKRRRPETSVLYNVIQEHFQSWSADFFFRHEEALPSYVEREFRSYIKCGVLAYGFARARCSSCQHDFLIAFSCKTKSLCPSCCSKYMAQTAVHLVEEVLPMLRVA